MLFPQAARGGCVGILGCANKRPNFRNQSNVDPYHSAPEERFLHPNLHIKLRLHHGRVRFSSCPRTMLQIEATDSSSPPVLYGSYAMHAPAHNSPECFLKELTLVRDKDSSTPQSPPPSMLKRKTRCKTSGIESLWESGALYLCKSN